MAVRKPRVEQEHIKKRQLCLVTGTSNTRLAKDISEYLGINLFNVEISRFSDGEVRVDVKDSVRGKDVFIVQPTCPPVNENLMELLIMLDAMRRASARRMHVVMPYYGYSRQDKKLSPREPITAKLVANLLEMQGIKRMLVMDLHADSIQGFFNIPVDHLSSMPIIVNYLKHHNLHGPKTCVVSPDVGGVVRARNVAVRINSPLAILSKRRPKPNEAVITEIIGSVEGMKCVMIDDMADTAGTLCKGAEMLMNNGAKEVRAVCSHGLLSGGAVQRIRESVLKELIITDSVPLPPEKRDKKIKVVSVAPLFGEAIKRAFEDISISELFQS
jgi:ribose-phosphate pyrophosphokinase